MVEEWRDIPGFEGFYQVSSCGRVKSLPRKQSPNEKYLTLFDNGRSLVTGLSANGRTLHANVGVFVLTAFVGPKPSGQECCHNDGNYKNNSLSNLRWDTHKSNCEDTVSHGNSRRGTKNIHNVLSDLQVLTIKETLKRPYWGVQTALAREYGVTPQTISLIAKGKLWQHL